MTECTVNIVVLLLYPKRQILYDALLSGVRCPFPQNAGLCLYRYLDRRRFKGSVHIAPIGVLRNVPLADGDRDHGTSSDVSILCQHPGRP